MKKKKKIEYQNNETKKWWISNETKKKKKKNEYQMKQGNGKYTDIFFFKKFDFSLKNKLAFKL